MKKHVVILDLFRFFAALAVLLYHYTAYDFKTWAAPVTRFGYLGVPLFFLISGFVIVMSLQGARSPLHFIVNRAIRLYPAFIACSLITLAYVGLLTQGPYFSAYDVAANMTMYGEHLHARLINPAYWSLAVEWTFYLMVFAIVATVGVKRVTPYLWAWLAASWLFALYDFGFVGKVLALHSAPYFVGGAAIYLMSTGEGRRDWRMRLLCLLSLPIAAHWELARATNVGIVDTPGRTVVLLAVIACYALMIVAAYLPRANAAPKLFDIAGRISYPLYLVHETIGVSLLRRYYTPGPAGYWLIIGLAIGMIVLAYLVAEYVEKPTIARLKRYLSARRRAPAASA